MTHQQILTKAIRKAIEGGWQPNLGILFVNKTSKQAAKYIAGSRAPAMFIFDHNFAKALWNTPRFAIGEIHFETREGLSEWEYHLQRMVIAPDPIAYLGENLPEISDGKRQS